jgi:hypothetical protein
MKNSLYSINSVRRSSRTAVFVAGICVAVLSGCGSSSSKSSDTSVSAAEVSEVTSETAPLVETTLSSEPSSTLAKAVDTIAEPSSQAGTTSASAASATPAAGKAFTDCLKENGVVLPEGFALPSAAGQGGTPEIPAGVDLGKLQAAMGKCKDKMPAAASGTGGNETSIFISCLRENGVDVPADATLAQVPAGDPAFAAANAKCEPLLQSAGEAPPTTG